MYNNRVTFFANFLTRYSKFFIGCVISISCIYWLYQRFNWQQLMRALQSIDKMLIVISLAPLLIAYTCFSKKLGCLIGRCNKISIFELLRIHMFSLLCNVVLPIRLGDVIKIFLIKPYVNALTTYSFSVIFLERLLDILILCVLGTGTLFFLKLPSELTITLYSMSAIIMFLSVGLILLAYTNKFFFVMDRVVTKYCASFSKSKIILSIKKIGGQITNILRSSSLIYAVILCLIGWLLVVFNQQLIFYAFGLELSFSKIIFFVVITQLSAAIPSMPASIGVYHSIAVICLFYWGVEYNLSLAIAIVGHGIIVMVQVVGGLICQLLHVVRGGVFTQKR